MREIITHEHLLNAGYDYDLITYSKGNLLLAPHEEGYHVFSNGLKGGITSSIKYITELDDLVKQ